MLENENNIGTRYGKTDWTMELPKINFSSNKESSKEEEESEEEEVEESEEEEEEEIIRVEDI